MSQPVTLSRAACINALNVFRLPVLRDVKFEGKARYAVRKNVLILTRVARDVEASRSRLFAKHFPDHADPSQVTPETPGWEDFKNEVFAFLETPVEIAGLIQFPFEALKLEDNDIPENAIAALEPLLSVDIQ